MVCDIAGTMDAVAASGEESVLRAMLSRIRAWQEFMRRTPRGAFPEAEVGLAGELAFLELLLDAGMSPQSLWNLGSAQQAEFRTSKSGADRLR